MSTAERSFSDGDISASPEYRAAVSLFARHDYVGALSRVDALLADPRFAAPGPDRDFLLRQRDICSRATDTPSPDGTHGGTMLPTAPSRDNSASIASTAPTPAAAPAVLGSADCGPRALIAACERIGVRADLASLRATAGTGRAGTTLAGLGKAAEAAGLSAEAVQMDGDALANLKPPAVAWIDGNHFVTVLHVDGDARTETSGSATVRDPNHTQEEVISLRALLSRSGGVLLTLRRR